MQKNNLTTKEKDLGKWYDWAISEAKLIAYGQIKGTTYFLPNGWAIWSNIQKLLDGFFKKMNIQNIQLPTFIKYSEFIKESEHVESFAPEVFVVTSNNKKQLAEPLIVRPTSEIIFCDCFKKVLKSYNDLPILYNQWCNVFRVEKNTRPFLRTSEFYWHELHTIHASEQEATKQTLKTLDMYCKLLQNELCIPYIAGKKTDNEKFGGAQDTYTLESFMPDGQALQCCTSHYLGTNFAKAYDLKFQNKTNAFQFPYQTSAGLSTRIIGGLIMIHGDDNGLVLPFNIAPIQIGIIALNPNNTKSFNKYIDKIVALINKFNFTYRIDESLKSMGWKIRNFQVQGTPLVLIIGQNEYNSKNICIIRRDLTNKFNIPFLKLNAYLKNIKNDFNNNIYNKAKLVFNSKIVNVDNFEEFKKVINLHKVALCYFKQTPENERKIKELTGATARCIKKRLDVSSKIKCFFSNEIATDLVYFARAY